MPVTNQWSNKNATQPIHDRASWCFTVILIHVFLKTKFTLSISV